VWRGSGEFCFKLATGSDAPGARLRARSQMRRPEPEAVPNLMRVVLVPTSDHVHPVEQDAASHREAEPFDLGSAEVRVLRDVRLTEERNRAVATDGSLRL
jgi:hypothetical protein